jgi:dolichol-phosphate mannosyltransferase
MTISVILATYNERENLPEMVKRIHEQMDPVAARSSWGGRVEIIVVDDDSPDKTWELAQSMLDPAIKVVRRQDRGLASAIFRGIMESTGEIICWWDCDMLMCPETAKSMIPLLKDYDIVIGSRYAEGGGDHREASRVIPSIMINSLASLILGHGIRDYDSGFVIFRRDVLNTVLPMPEGYGEYFIEFMYSAAKRGLRIHEHPYVLTDRTRGTSKSVTSTLSFIMTGIKYGIRIFIALFRG